MAGPVRVRAVGEVDRERFERFVAQHPAGSVLQSWAWGELRSRQGWAVTRLLAEDVRGQPCGAATVLGRSLPVGGSVLYLPRGPVIDFRDHRLLDALAGALRRLGRRRRAVFCKVDPYVTPPDPVLHLALAARGFVAGQRLGRFDGLQPRFNVIVPLAGGPETVLGRMHAKTRYNVRLALRRGVEVRRGSRADLPTFHRLLQETCVRNGFGERGLAYFLQVWDALAPAGHAELFLAGRGGLDLAAGILFVHGAKAVYAYGASASEQRDLMAPYALQWAMIRRACERGCRTYDMTGVPRRLVEGEPAYGLWRFKRGFWPEVSEFQGEYDLPLQPALYRLWNVLEPAYRRGQVWTRQVWKGLRGARAHGTPAAAVRG